MTDHPVDADDDADDVRSWRLELHGDIDLQSAPELARRLEELALEHALLVVVDLSDVEFLDSSGIRALVHGARLLEAAGGQLLVEGASGAVARVLELTDLLRRLSGEETEAV